ncbi:MAG: hypothetical protein JWL81_1378 [Verrucomicrobiales bacterium]|nr:hypothetical protein [Verrucomicrobiales bacterium]
MKITLKSTLMLGGVSASLWAPLAKADFFQAPYGPGGTWRIYETPRAAQNFKNALADASAAMDPVTGTVPGSLVSVTSLAKTTFLYRTIGRAPGDSWIGLTDREGAAPGAFESQGEPDNRTAGWAWTNGDPFTFSNWAGGEPNDVGGEDAGQMRADTLWNDNKGGWAIDEPEPPELKAGTSGDETTGPSIVYMVEYPIDSPTPLVGIRMGMVFPPCADFKMPLNTAGNWSVREIRGLTLPGNAFDSIDKALAYDPMVVETGTATEGSSPYLDFVDPDTNANGGPALGTAPFPFLTNGAGDDDNIINIATTRISIAPGKAGLYTIRVHGDDGFAMRIKGVPWVSVGGNNTDGGRGYIDPMDPTALVFERGTGDANTMATINLAAGEYDVEFLNWEGGGGAYYEVSATSGDGISGGLAQWQPFGSNTDIPAVNTLAPVRLAAAAQVRNATTWSRGNSLPAVRYLIDNAVRGVTKVDFTNLVIGEGAMPNNNGGDNYITKVTGQIVVESDANANATPGELIDVTFRLNCDDGASMRIIGQDFLAVNAGRTLVDNGGDMTMTADFPTGDTDVRGRVQLTEGQTYQFVSYMYEYGGGSKYELYWDLGDKVDSNLTAAAPLSDTGAVHLNVSAVVANTPQTYDNQGSLPEAAAVLDAVAPVIGTNAGPVTSLVISEGAMPNNNGGDNYATKVTGKITLAADADGDSTPGEEIYVTFRLSCDDGANLRIIGKDFDGTNGGTTILVDVAGDMVLTADFPTGDTNAIGRIKLVEGQTYDLASYMFEFGGGSKYELYWEIGDSLGGLATTTPLSDNALDAVHLTSIPDPVGSPGTIGALVQNAKFGARTSILPHARSIMNTAITQGLTNDGTATTVVLRGDDNLTGRPGANVFASSTIFPVGINQDNYVSQVNGQIIVNDQDGTPGETLTLTFGIFADDGMSLRIVGQNFNLVNDTSGDGVAYISRVGGDAIIAADYPGGNCQAFGRIDLVEGTYTFEALEFEGGGGSSMEVWYALGDKTAGYDGSYRPLNDQAGISLPANTGIPLIAGLDKDGDNDGLPTTYEVANGLSDSNAADALLDNDKDGSNNLAEYAAGTNPNNPTSFFQITSVTRAGADLLVAVPTKAGHHYTLYSSPDLGSPWTAVGLAYPTADGVTTWTIPGGPTPPAKYFFRLEAEFCE